MPIGINLNVNFLACLILFLAARPTLREVLVMCAAGVGLGAYLGFHGSIIHKILEALSYCGAGAIPTVWLMPLLRRRSDLLLLGKLVLPPGFGGLSALLLGLGASGLTYDRLLYAFDGSLGFQPAFLAGQAVSAVPWIGQFTRALYDGLPIFLTIAYLLQERRGRREARDFFLLLISIGICGALCFLIFPAVGAYYIYAKSFPFHPPDLSSLSIVPVAVTAAVPRNCMPSLHTSWALAVIWAARRFGTAWRLVLRGLLMLMLLQTLVFHYLVDMVVAVPFTLALYALTQSAVPWAARERWRALVCGVSLVSVWLVALRWATEIFMRSPAISWIAVLLTIGVSCRLWHLLERAGEEQPHGESIAEACLRDATVSA